MMRSLATLIFATLLLGMAAPALAEPETGSRVDRARSAVTDTANEPNARQAVNQFSRCIGETRAQWADQVLELPLNSAEQMALVRKRIGGWDDCMQTWQFDMAVPPPSLIGGMAEARVRKLYKVEDAARFAAVTDDQLFASPAAPRDTGEDFAMCLVRKNPVAARQLLETQVAGPLENAAVQRLMPNLPDCVPAGVSLALNKSTIRVYVAYGLYRLHTKYPAAARNGG